jgi:hypothetical protein
MGAASTASSPKPGCRVGEAQVSSALTKLLKNGAAGYTWAAATIGAEAYGAALA